MQKQLYIIEYESAHWCGGESHCVTWAHNPEEAVENAESHMDQEMRELFSDEYRDEYGNELEDDWVLDECAFIVNSVEVLDKANSHWEYYQDLKQRAAFYPEV